MRVTQSMYYANLFGNSDKKLNRELFDVNRQIASGLKIQYASGDVRIFTETMRLDNELTTIQQVKKSTESGYKFSNQTDVTMNEFTDSMNRMRTLLVQAANGTNDATSLDAIAAELRGVEENLYALANTSINGQYLFSGSAVDTKPIDANGKYKGNNIELKAFVGSNNQQKYNITGSEFFLGEESLVNREVSTNVVQTLNAPAGSLRINPESLMSEFMGNAPSNKHYFYLRGVQSDGKSFNKQIEMENSGTIQQLLRKIGDAYGNTGAVDVVNVTMTEAGQIVVEDKVKGSSKLDFHMVGATDFNPDANDAANVTHIDSLSGATNDYAIATSAGGTLYVKEFINSNFTSAVGVTGLSGSIYDRTEFTKDGSKLFSNISQILKRSHEITVGVETIDTIAFHEKNGFATPSTLLSEVADISKGTLDTADDTLDGVSFVLAGRDINNNAYNATIDLKSIANGGSTVTVGGQTYDIFNAQNPRTATDADKFTYQQLMDVMNIVVTGKTGQLAGNSAVAYDTAIKSANLVGTMSLSQDARIEFNDLNAATTPATIALYDANSGNFALDIDSDGDGTNDKASASVMSFNANNSITVRDPKTDFFRTINEMIEAVENHGNYPDSLAVVVRNIGIQNSLKAMDDLQDHVFRTQSIAGAQSNTLNNAIERTDILQISTMSLRSSVIDTDLADSSLRLSQLSLNYQAMLSTVGKISQLSLVNYL